jgi:hypothetical protein
MAEKKSEDTRYLLLHTGIYTFLMSLGLWSILPGHNLIIPIVFGLINGITHFAIDAVTSRLTKHFYQEAETLKSLYSDKEKVNVRMSCFWEVIGFDQFLHISILLITLNQL